jgi:hypothetical protein
MGCRGNLLGMSKKLSDWQLSLMLSEHCSSGWVTKAWDVWFDGVDKCLFRDCFHLLLTGEEDQLFQLHQFLYVEYKPWWSCKKLMNALVKAGLV